MGDLPWFRVRTEEDIEKLARWGGLKGCNTYSPRTDKNGNPICFLGWDDRPDSDWGRYKGHRAAIWFASAELLEKADDTIRIALWGKDAPKWRDAYNAGKVHGEAGGALKDNPHDWKVDRKTAEAWREGCDDGQTIYMREKRNAR